MDRDHRFPCSNITSSWIKDREIVERLMKSKSACLLKSGPAILEKNENLMSSSDTNRMLCFILDNLFERFR